MASEKQGQQVPTDIRAFNARLIEEFRAHHGELSGQMAGRQLLLLTTTGSQSGAEHTVVVGYRPYNGALAIIASNNGAPKPPAWFANLEKNPTATVEVGPDKYQVRARVASRRERAEAAKKIEYLELQQAKAQREIPVVLLEEI